MKNNSKNIGFKDRNSNIPTPANIHTGGLPLNVGNSIGHKIKRKTRVVYAGGTPICTKNIR